MRFVVIVFAFIAAMLHGHVSAQSNTPLMMPGLWEITIQLESPDPGPVMVTQECISTQKSRPVPPKTKAKDDCQIVEVPAPANEMVYSVKCSKLARTSTSRFTYNGNRYEGIVTTQMGAVEIRTKYSARRIGDCEPDSSGAPGTEE